MPRRRFIADDVLTFLKGQTNGATMREIEETVRARRGPVLQHSVRSAVYAHLGDKGECLLRKRGDRNGRYFATR